MIGADLESRVASWAASAISDDAAAVRAMIEAYGDRLAAADVARDVSQYTGNAADIQPELETVVGSQQLTATYDAAFETCAWTLRSDSTTSSSKATPRQSGQQARGRSRSALPAKRNQRVSGSCSFWNARGATGRSRMYQQMPEQQEGAAPASSESATRIRIRSASACGRRARRGSGYAGVYVPVQGPCR